MARKTPKQLDLVEALEKKDRKNAKERQKRAEKKARKMPTIRKNTQPAKPGSKAVAKPGSKALTIKTHSGEYIPKDKPVGDAKTKQGRTIDGEKVNKQKKLAGEKRRLERAAKSGDYIPKEKPVGQAKTKQGKTYDGKPDKKLPSGSKAKGFMNKIKGVPKAGPIGAAATALSIMGAAVDLNNGENREFKNRRTVEAEKKAKQAKKAEAKKPEAKKAAAPAAKKESKAEPKKKSAAGSFREAFAAARKAYMAGKGGTTFEWNGKKYSVATKDDIKKSGKKDLREYLNAGLKPERKK